MRLINFVVLLDLGLDKILTLHALCTCIRWVKSSLLKEFLKENEKDKIEWYKCDVTYRVEENESFVHNLKRWGHHLVITLEFTQDVLSLFLLQLNQQTFFRLDIKGSDEQVSTVGGDLNEVYSLTKLFWLFVKDNSVLI